MCQNCGCGEIGSISINGKIELDAVHSHLHDREAARVSDAKGTSREGELPHSHRDESGNLYVHSHPHHGDNPHTHRDEIHEISIRQGLLTKNAAIAAQNRRFFRDRRILALNLLSSPGAGKTALIERMARDLPQLGSSQGGIALKMAAIVGDLATDNDARRLRDAGAPAVQITTGNACHLEADMVARAMQQLDWQGLNLVAIENVGNLVCPSSYDLGEELRVVILSVTEGEDKPLKYPTTFKTADIVLVSKVDVAEAVGCNMELAIANIRRIAPQARIFEVSARTGEGLDRWYEAIVAARETLPAS